MQKEILIIILALIILNGIRKFIKRHKKERTNTDDRDEQKLHIPETEKVDIKNDSAEKKAVDVKAVKSDLLQFVEQFSMKRSFWDHPIEAEIYSALRQFITNEYIIIPHDAFSNIFYWKWDKDWKLTDRVTKMHYDFAIYDNDFHLIFLIEVNGKKHEQPNRIEVDNFKTSLVERMGLKLITIDASKTIVNPQKEVEYRIMQEYPDRAGCPTYCPKCHSSIPMILQQNGNTKEYYYRCVNKECGDTHSLGKSGEYRKIAPLYRNMPDKLSGK